MRTRWVLSLVHGALAMLVAGAAVAAEPDPGKASIWGVWLGTNNLPNVDPRYRPTPWPDLQFTAWGAAESKRLTTPETPDACMPYGPMGQMSATSLFPLEIVKSSKGVLIMFEPSSLPRRIYTDGRKHPEELDPIWLGDSVGHWEGDTLVIDTVGTNGRGRPLNGYVSGAVYSKNDTAPRLPVSDQLHMVERIRVVGGGEYLEDEITVTDLKTYARSFTVKHYWQRRDDLDLLEYVCTESPRPAEEGHPGSSR